MKKLGLTIAAAIFLCASYTAEAKSITVTETPAETVLPAEEYVGTFEAEGKKIDVKFVRVLYAAEGSEREGEGNSVEQLIFDSKDPKGNAVKVYRYQIVAKNTGYDEVQTDQSEDYKLKSVAEGVKLHIEVPLVNGAPQFDKAYIGNLAYNFGTRETRHNLTAETISDIDFNIKRFELPQFGANHKPGDNGIIYNEGFIEFTMTSKAKYIGSDRIGDFTISVKGPISITHVRGKERQNNAVSIDSGVVNQNI